MKYPEEIYYERIKALELALNTLLLHTAHTNDWCGDPDCPEPEVRAVLAKGVGK